MSLPGCVLAEIQQCAECRRIHFDNFCQLDSLEDSSTPALLKHVAAVLRDEELSESMIYFGVTGVGPRFRFHLIREGGFARQGEEDVAEQNARASHWPTKWSQMSVLFFGPAQKLLTLEKEAIKRFRCANDITRGGVGTSLPELYFYVCHNRGPSCTCADCRRGNYLAYGWECSDDEADIEFMLPPLPKAPRLQEEASSSTTVAESGPPTTRASPAAAESGLHTTMAFMAPPAAVESWPAATMAPPAAAERAESGPMTTTMAPPAVSESEPTTTTAAPAMAENEPMTTMAPPAAVESGRPTTTTAMAPPAAVGSGPTTTMAPPAVAESGRSLPELPLASLPAVAESGRPRPLLELPLALEFIGPPGALKQARLRLAPDVKIHFKIKSNCARLYAIPKNDVEIEGGSSIEVCIHMKSSIASGSDAAANVIANHKFRVHVSGDGRSDLVTLSVSGLVEEHIPPVLRD